MSVFASMYRQPKEAYHFAYQISITLSLPTTTSIDAGGRLQKVSSAYFTVIYKE